MLAITDVKSESSESDAMYGGDFLRPWEAEQRGAGGHAVSESANTLQSLLSWSGTNGPKAS